MKVTVQELKECAEAEMATATLQRICDLEKELHGILKNYADGECDPRIILDAILGEA